MADDDPFASTQNRIGTKRSFKKKARPLTKAERGNSTWAEKEEEKRRESEELMTDDERGKKEGAEAAQAGNKNPDSSLPAPGQPVCSRAQLCVAGGGRRFLSRHETGS